MSQSINNLHLRLRNCLQTILDLEPTLERLDMGPALHKEFEMLKSFLGRVDTLNVGEEEVVRIETATATFLEELKTPLGMMEENLSSRRMMH